MRRRASNAPTRRLQLTLNGACFAGDEQVLDPDGTVTKAVHNPCSYTIQWKVPSLMYVTLKLCPNQGDCKPLSAEPIAGSKFAWSIPADLANGDYTLVVSKHGADGDSCVSRSEVAVRVDATEKCCVSKSSPIDTTPVTIISPGQALSCGTGNVWYKNCPASVMFTSAEDGDVSLEFRNTQGAAAVAAMSTSISSKAGTFMTHDYAAVPGDLFTGGTYQVAISATCRTTALSSAVTIQAYDTSPFKWTKPAAIVKTCGTYDFAYTIPAAGPAAAAVTVELINKESSVVAATLADKSTATSVSLTVPPKAELTKTAGSASTKFILRVRSSASTTACVPTADTELEIQETTQDDLAVVSPASGSQLNGCLKSHSLQWKKPEGMAKTSVYVCKTDDDCSTNAANQVAVVATDTDATQAVFTVKEGTTGTFYVQVHPVGNSFNGLCSRSENCRNVPIILPVFRGSVLRHLSSGSD